MASLPYNVACNCTNVDPNAPDSNIAGPGVLVGFILTGTITFISSCTTIWLRRLSSTTCTQPHFLRRLTPRTVPNPAEFWISILTELVLQLSDQQLVVGFLLLICAYIKYWPSSVVYGGNNLWTATDIVCFSSFTHAATLLTLRPYFRNHKRLATCRVIMMYTIYILWLVVAAQILSPNKPRGSTKEPQVIADFWHAATYIEALGVMWIYLITYLLIFLSQGATKVRNIISEERERDFHVVDAWIRYHWRRKSAALERRTKWKRFSPYAVVRRFLTRFAVRFSELYVNTGSIWLRRMLWVWLSSSFPGMSLGSSSVYYGRSASEHLFSAFGRVALHLRGILASYYQDLWSCRHSKA